MTEPLSVQQMAQRLKSADNILILCHKNPDGDTVGCGSALYYALKALDKNAAVLCSDTIPARYAFTNAHLFKGEFEPETVIAVDVAGLQLFGEGNGVPRYSRHVDLCIDHHAGNSGYADFTLLDGSASGSGTNCEMICMGIGFLFSCQFRSTNSFSTRSTPPVMLASPRNCPAALRTR